MSENTNNQNASLLRRAYLFLEDEDWDRADEYADRVLDSEPENAEAYLCKLLSEFGVTHKEELAEVAAEISKSKNYSNALKFGNESEKDFLKDCAKKAEKLFREQESKKVNQDMIDTFTETIDGLRDIQKLDRAMIKRGKGAVRMYFICYLVVVALIVPVVLGFILPDGEGVNNLAPLVTLPLGLGIPTCWILFTIAHAKLVRFWDLDYRNDRGWSFPILYGMINAMFTLTIWGFVKCFQTINECKKFKGIIDDMERTITDMQRQIREKQALIK